MADFPRTSKQTVEWRTTKPVLIGSGELLLIDDVFEVGSGQTVDIASDGILSVIGSPRSSGTELDYGEMTTNLSVTATTAATANTMVAGNAVTYDGSRLKIEFFCGGSDRTVNNLIALYLDGVSILDQWAQGPAAGPIYAVKYHVPTPGSHTFSARVWKTSGTSNINATGIGATFLRVSIA